MRRTAIVLMLITIFSKIFGFVRDITLSYFYGASNVSDAYLISQVIPFVVFSFIGTGITTGYIPMYSRIEQDEGVIEGNRYTNNLVNILIVLCTFIIIAGLIFTNQIVRIFASGFEGETLALAVRFTKISLYGVCFTGIIYVFTGYLQIKGNYVIPALVGIPMNFFVILSIFASSTSNVLVLAIGSLIATIAQLMLLIPYVYRKGYRYKLVFDINDKHIRNMAYIALPVIIGVSVNQINILVDRTIASQIVVGGISALNYANRLNEFIQGIFVLSISTSIYPMISRMAADNNMKDFKRYLSESINGINLLVIPSTIGAMIFSEQIITLLFRRGAFDRHAVVLTSQALFFIAVGILGFGLREILSRAFYALQDTKTPMINAAIALIMNIVLNIILSKFLGIGGLALATSISALFCTGLLFVSLRKKIGSFGIKNIAVSFLKILCASLLMGAMAKLVYNTLFGRIPSSVSLVAAIGIGALVYFTIIYFMKIDDVEVIVSTLKGKVKKLLRHD